MRGDLCPATGFIGCRALGLLGWRWLQLVPWKTLRFRTRAMRRARELSRRAVMPELRVKRCRARLMAAGVLRARVLGLLPVAA